LWLWQRSVDTGMEMLLEYRTSKAELDAQAVRRPILGPAKLNPAQK
jgi:hypothetical protein